MKSFLLALVLITTNALAVGQPITENVRIENRAFAGKIYKALGKNIKPVRTYGTRGSVLMIEIQDIIRCEKVLPNRYRALPSYNCLLLSPTWAQSGEKAFITADYSKNFTALFETLQDSADSAWSIPAASFIELSLNTENNNGIVGINRLVCMIPSAQSEAKGIKAGCLVENNL